MQINMANALDTHTYDGKLDPDMLSMLQQACSTMLTHDQLQATVNEILEYCRQRSVPADLHSRVQASLNLLVHDQQNNLDPISRLRADVLLLMTWDCLKEKGLTVNNN